MSKILTDEQWTQANSLLAQVSALLAAATGATAPPVGSPPPADTSGVESLSFKWVKGGYSPAVPMFGDKILSCSFTTPAQPVNGIGRITFGDQAYGQHVFALALAPGLISLNGPPADPRILQQRAGTGCTMNFSVGPNTRGAVELAPGTTYYFNVANWDMSGQQPSQQGPCFVTLYAP